MIINRIVIENWLPFADRTELELGTGPHAVVATYTDNPNRSNWAGKTAFLEAIEWCLFGVHRKRYEDDVIFKDADQVFVGLKIDTEEGSLHITRTRKRGKATKFEVLDTDGTKHEKKAADQRLIDLLGFDSADYRATVCFAQGDTEAIVDRTSGERRKIVGQWLELDAWFRIAARARTHAKTLADQHADVTASIKSYKDWIAGSDVEELKSVIEHTTKEIAKQRRAYETSNAALDEVAGLESARLDFERVAELRTDAAEVKKQIIAFEYDEAAHAKAAEEHAEHVAAVQAISREHRQAVDLTRGEFCGTCPVTDQQCPIADDIRANESAAAAKVRAVEKRMSAAIPPRDAAQRAVFAFEKQARDLDRLRNSYNAIVSKIKLLAVNADRWDPESAIDDDAIARHREMRTQANEQLRNFQREQDQCASELDKIEQYTEQLATLTKDAKVIENDLRIANIAAKSVGPSGIPARIAEIALAELEESANGLLAGTGLSFAFAWDRETKDVAPSCYECGYVYRGKRDKACPSCNAERTMKRADELEILVDDGSGTLEDVKAKSGGAKVLIGSAIRLAAGAMLRTLRGSRCAWSQIDEPFGALDAENRKTLANTFAGMLDAVGLEQTFVVSHDAALLDSLPNRIEITREGDRSVVRVAV